MAREIDGEDRVESRRSSRRSVSRLAIGQVVVARRGRRSGSIFAVEVQLTVPIGPWRCLAMMTSATLWICSPRSFQRSMRSSNLSSVSSGALLRLGALVVVLLAVDEHDDVGVLLDRAGFAQVGELRPLVLALLDRARELRQRQHRHVQLLGHRLQAAGDLRDLLHPVLAAAGADRRASAADSRRRSGRARAGASAGARACAGPAIDERRRVVDEERQRASAAGAAATNCGEIVVASPRRAGSGRRRCRSARRGCGWRAARPTFRARRRRPGAVGASVAGSSRVLA